MRPASAISQVAACTVVQVRRTPRPPPWRMLLPRPRARPPRGRPPYARRLLARRPTVHVVAQLRNLAIGELTAPRTRRAAPEEAAGHTPRCPRSPGTRHSPAVGRRARREGGSLRSCDHVGRKRVRVVRTDQRERHGRCERQIEQRLVALALADLVGASIGPDRLADTVQRLTASPCARRSRSTPE